MTILTIRSVLVGLAMLVILIAAGSYLIWRAVNRELAVARLQSDFVSAVSHEFRTPLIRVELLLAYDMQTKQEREIMRIVRQGPTPALGSVALSPDGRRLAVVEFPETIQSGALLVIPAEGGTPRELIHASNSESLGFDVAWLPDGKHVIFRKGPAGAPTFRIPADGGVASPYRAEWSGDGLRFG